MTAPHSQWAADGGVLVDVEAGVATVTFNRPPGNGWTPTLGRAFFGALDQLAVDRDVRAIVVTGGGKDFCIGADAGGLDTVAKSGEYETAADRPSYYAALEIAKPVIAAVNGACFGVGMQLALLCDIRFAGASTKFATAFARRGLIAELGLSWLLPRIVGLGVANDLLLSGRLVRVEEAERLGLVNGVVGDEELLAAAQDYARDLASKCSPASMAVIKRQTYTDLTSHLPNAVERADVYLKQALESADFAEGVRSWSEKRAPRFPGLDPELAHFRLPS